MSTFEHIETFRAEHRSLIRHVAALRQTADALDDMSVTDRSRAINDILDFLQRSLFPHAVAEEEVLYPAVGAILGDSRATAPMELDHVAIHERTRELAETSLEHVGALRRELYGLDALIREHFRKEEELYLPLLEGQDEEYVGALMARLHRAAHSAA